MGVPALHHLKVDVKRRLPMCWLLLKLLARSSFQTLFSRLGELVTLNELNRKADLAKLSSRAIRCKDERRLNSEGKGLGASLSSLCLCVVWSEV